MVFKDEVFTAFAQWTKQSLHVISSEHGELRRRRYDPSKDSDGNLLPEQVDSRSGYCLLLCDRADDYIVGYRAVEFDSLLELIREEVEERDAERKRRRAPVKRKPCTCKGRMLTCESSATCECKASNPPKKCIASRHGDDHRSCCNSTPANKKKKGNGESQQRPIAQNGGLFPNIETLLANDELEVNDVEDDNHQHAEENVGDEVEEPEESVFTGDEASVHDGESNEC